MQSVDKHNCLCSSFLLNFLCLIAENYFERYFIVVFKFTISVPNHWNTRDITDAHYLCYGLPRMLVQNAVSAPLALARLSLCRNFKRLSAVGSNLCWRVIFSKLPHRSTFSYDFCDCCFHEPTYRVKKNWKVHREFKLKSLALSTRMCLSPKDSGSQCKFVEVVCDAAGCCRDLILRSGHLGRPLVFPHYQNGLLPTTAAQLETFVPRAAHWVTLGTDTTPT